MDVSDYSLRKICSGELTDSLQKSGVCMIHDLYSQEWASYLADQAQELTYTTQPEFVGKRNVRQQIASARVQSCTPLHAFATAIQHSVECAVGGHNFESGGLHFNDRIAQRYLDGSHGIDPHADHAHNRNLILICGLQGVARFTVYDCIGGHAIEQHMIKPGGVLVMVAPGYKGETRAPIHGVDMIVGERYVLGLRQSTSRPDG